MKRCSFRKWTISAVCVVVGIPVTANAQWTETVLNADYAIAWGASGAQQVGQYAGRPSPESSYAALWSGTAASIVNLNPAGAGGSVANGTSGSQQVGQAQFALGPYAGIWSGTAASWVNLNPAGAIRSDAMGISGTQEVGDAQFGYEETYAGIWSGTAASWVDLNPAGSVKSEALGTSGTQQVGWTDPTVGQGEYAALWSGTAGSYVDLNPAGGYESEALAISANTEVGQAFTPESNGACLWHGTAASFVNLNPAGASGSAATGVAGNIVVGAAEFASSPIEEAGYWTGTAASWVQLPALSDYSYATGVSVVGNTVYIVGEDNESAVVWTNTDLATPEPSPVAALSIGVLGLFLRKRRNR